MYVIAAVDTDEHAERVVEEALSLASAFGDTLQVVHAVPSTEFAAIQREHVSAGGDTLTREQVARSHLDSTLDPDVIPESVDLEVVGLDGEPAEAILEHAASLDTRYIVLGGRDRTPVGKAVFGSIAQSVILEAETPVVMAGDR